MCEPLSAVPLLAIRPWSAVGRDSRPLRDSGPFSPSSGGLYGRLRGEVVRRSREESAASAASDGLHACRVIVHAGQEGKRARPGILRWGRLGSLGDVGKRKRATRPVVGCARHRGRGCKRPGYARSRRGAGGLANHAATTPAGRRLFAARRGPLSHTPQARGTTSRPALPC